MNDRKSEPLNEAEGERGRAARRAEGPSPVLPPVADYLVSLAATGVVVAVAGVVVFSLVAGRPARVEGATRSMRLKWEQRQELIEQAARESSSEQGQEGATNEPRPTR